MIANRTAIVFLLFMLLAACGVAVPDNKAGYIGEWTAPGMYLLISQDGGIVYRRMKKGAKVSIEGPLKGFAGDDFEVGIGPMATKFKVERPPHQVDGNWHMTVDGVDMIRQ